MCWRYILKAVIKINSDNIITGKVYDTLADEEYLPLRYNCSNTCFIKEVQDNYKLILENIRDKCFIEQSFIFNQANRIADYVLKKYGDKPLFLWEKFPNYAVFKNSYNNKWYMAIMNIDYSKIDKTKSGEIEIIDVKIDKDKVDSIIKENGIYPAYHMNKQSWITILLDDTLADNIIFDYIDYSYLITKQKK